MINYSQRQAAVAQMAAALKDADRSLIGDPRKKEYKVATQFRSIKDAIEFGRTLIQLGIPVHTTIVHEVTFGDPLGATVHVYDKDGQRVLLALVEGELHDHRREQLENLVLARGPIPDDILERVVKARERGWSVAKTAEKMNEQGIIAGRGAGGRPGR